MTFCTIYVGHIWDEKTMPSRLPPELKSHQAAGHYFIPVQEYNPTHRPGKFLFAQSPPHTHIQRHFRYRLLKNFW